MCIKAVYRIEYAGKTGALLHQISSRTTAEQHNIDLITVFFRFIQ